MLQISLQSPKLDLDLDPGVVLVAGKVGHDVAGQQLFLREQASVLKRLAVGKIVQGVEPELEQERRGGDISVGCPGLRRARA